MKTQGFGIKIELTGITRRDAAKLIAGYYNTIKVFVDGINNVYIKHQ